MFARELSGVAGVFVKGDPAPRLIAALRLATSLRHRRRLGALGHIPTYAGTALAHEQLERKVQT